MTAGAVPTEQRQAEAFPELTAAQLARLGPHGHRRKLAAGEVVGEPGDPVTHIFVILSGQLHGGTVSPSPAAPGFAFDFTRSMFTGERSVLAGGRFLGRIAATEPTEVLTIERDELLKLIQTDTELGDIFLRAFILRRLELIEHGVSDVVILGSYHCSGTLHIIEFLVRNGHPYSFRDLDKDPQSQELIDRFHLKAADVPLVICRGSTLLRNPTVEQLADCLGLNPTIDKTQVWDVVIIGAGPAGLGAAVYAASEGLNVMILEANAPGGQAGTSSKIENYLGFPLGISGQELAARAYDQAQKFGATMLIAKKVVRINCDQRPYRVFLEQGPPNKPLLTRSIIIASGAEYRRLAVENLSRFENAGVYYAATQMERRLCTDEAVAVVGGANSAGQAAVFLAERCRHVHVAIRGEGLASTMSRYLISRIEAHPGITLHPHTEIVRLEGNGHLESIAWRDAAGQVETQPIRHVFMMTGAQPSTEWLAGCLALDPHGFVKTGSALTQEDLETWHWPLRRPPHLLETSLPGVFSIGDVRSGSTKRVASAVGEGSIAVATVHQVLAE